MAAIGTPRARLKVPPLIYAGERDELLRERAEVEVALKRLQKSPRLRAGWEKRLTQINARLLLIEASPTFTPSTRADLQ